jgi:hypothetical protein
VTLSCVSRRSLIAPDPETLTMKSWLLPALSFTVVVACCLALAETPVNSGALRASMPVGYDVVELRPSGMNLSLMGLVECPEMEGARHVAEGIKAAMINANGERMHTFPRHFSFRVTASLRKIVTNQAAFAVRIPDDPNALLLNLRFRVKVYHGLEMREVFPVTVQQIGMPADVPYDERVYRVGVNIGDLPISDRFVIEVLTPEGELLTHFPFGLL